MTRTISLPAINRTVTSMSEQDRIENLVWAAKQSAAYWQKHGDKKTGKHQPIIDVWLETARRLETGEITDYDNDALLAGYEKSSKIGWQ